MKKFIVHCKGGPGDDSWEIAVVREDNLGGQRSFGWFDGEFKQFIGSSGGPCHEKVTEEVWEGLLALAAKVARHRNDAV